MNRRISYGCSQLRLVEETQADLARFFFFFSYYVHVIKLVFCLKKDTLLCLYIAICVLNILCKNIWLEIEKNQICPNPPPCVGGFGHGWTNRSPENQRLIH